MKLAIAILLLPLTALADARIWALEQIESGGDVTAIGDGGEAVGVLQITPIMVREVNRRLGEERFTLDSRACAACSREMARIALAGADTAEEVVDVWNPGAGRDYAERLGNLMRWRSDNNPKPRTDP